jgi:UDPglucose--hexose-1-phosphate uridylyltransferase
MSFDFAEHPHRRLNALTGEWVLVSPQRTKRPWRGQLDRPTPAQRPTHDPSCYLCPGNQRAGWARNPDYQTTLVFTNDFPALLPDVPTAPAPTHPLLQARPVHGTCRVLCFCPRHDLTLAQLSLAEIRGVVELWAEQVAELGQRFRWVQVFENRGEQMGASNPHPHGQVWALDVLPTLPAREDAAQLAYLHEQEHVLLLDYAQVEAEHQARVVVDNDHWLAVVPFWAVWPFEILLLPRRRRVAHLPALTDDERAALAALLKPLLVKLDNLFETPFPYSMGWHGAWHGPGSTKHWQLHAHLYPPLLRSASVRKFMVGFEMLSEPQRDITAEQAATRLRDLSTRHYLDA